MPDEKDEKTEVERWFPQDFSRLHYRIAQSDKKEFDKASRIEFFVKVDGQQVCRMELREPGILAIVSKPDDLDGIDLEVVQPGGTRYVDLQTPGIGNSSEPLANWQIEALEIVK